jgi:DNA-binding transcriptional LysR family regulator
MAEWQLMVDKTETSGRKRPKPAQNASATAGTAGAANRGPDAAHGAGREAIGGALEDVRAFCAVMALGTISAAARQLGETKGGVSRRISRLERRLDAVLLTRTPRAVTATAEGESFYAKAQDALALLDEAADGARQARAVPRGHLRVTAPHDIALDVLPTLLTEFRAAHTQITVELLITDAKLDLATHRIDLALRATTRELPDMAYRASVLVEFREALYAAPVYLAANPAPQRPADLGSHALITVLEPQRGAGRLTLTAGNARSETVLTRPVMHVSDYAGAHRLLLAGAGVGTLPEIIAAASVARGRLVPVLPEWTAARARLHAISVAGREAPARVRVFREFLRERLEGMVARGGA